MLQQDGVTECDDALHATFTHLRHDGQRQISDVGTWFHNALRQLVTSELVQPYDVSLKIEMTEVVLLCGKYRNLSPQEITIKQVGHMSGIIRWVGEFGIRVKIDILIVYFPQNRLYLAMTTKLYYVRCVTWQFDLKCVFVFLNKSMYWG